MLLSLRFDSQIQKYLYKIVMVCIQAVSIIWSKLVSGRAVICYVMRHLNTNDFYFILFYFSDFTFRFFILFSFKGWWRGMWQGNHMTGHMMWYHKPRTWWKDLEDDVRAHGVCMVALSKKWGKHEVEAWTIGQV